LERVLKMERGCVEDQPQPVRHAESLENSEGLRLVENDTAALRHFSNRLLAIMMMVAALAAGCGGHDHEHGHGHGHEHIPPHGGTPVILGNEHYHLEFLQNAETGQMHAYILDGHMDRFIRIPAESFEVEAQLPDRREALVFRAVANPATGETVGDTAQFTAEAEWLRHPVEFDAVLKSISIRGREYSSVKFNFPKGH
jgi:hypothetical protein